MTSLIHNPIVLRLIKAAALGALTGAGGAARADYHAFKTWNSVADAKAYNWSVAAWRWFQGAVTGAVGGVTVALGATGVGALMS